MPETPLVEQTTEAVTKTIAEQYIEYKRQQSNISKLGSTITPHYQPHTLLNHPPSPADVTLELLLASEAHQGHVTSLWNPANARYIHGIRQGVHIISLEATAAHLRRAAKVVQEVSRLGGIVLFVGTRDGQDRAVVRAAELAKGYHLFERWIPGSITNGQQILGRCRTKVVNEKDEEIPGFEDQLYEMPVLRPDLVVVMNPLENYVLLHECALNNIPTIGVIDTNVNPTWVTYPIPANDDSIRCIQVIAGVLGRAGEAGQKKRLEAAARGEITYRPAVGLELPLKEDAPSTPKKAKAKSTSPTANAEEIAQIKELARKEDEEDALEEKLMDQSLRQDTPVVGNTVQPAMASLAAEPPTINKNDVPPVAAESTPQAGTSVKEDHVAVPAAAKEKVPADKPSATITPVEHKVVPAAVLIEAAASVEVSVQEDQVAAPAEIKSEVPTEEHTAITNLIDEEAASVVEPVEEKALSNEEAAPVVAPVAIELEPHPQAGLPIQEDGVAASAEAKEEVLAEEPSTAPAPVEEEIVHVVQVVEEEAEPVVETAAPVVDPVEDKAEPTEVVFPALAPIAIETKLSGIDEEMMARIGYAMKEESAEVLEEKTLDSSVEQEDHSGGLTSAQYQSVSETPVSNEDGEAAAGLEAAAVVESVKQTAETEAAPVVESVEETAKPVEEAEPEPETVASTGEPQTPVADAEETVSAEEAEKKKKEEDQAALDELIFGTNITKDDRS
ncbi:hypothetical protein K504DRAFT_214168 [Pleomassaria siparia CBS 279.74]|uniref:Ribosomal protein S2 n=1 Tax=Pleomassaria siparia CBS 279.74 TaxID=1314801 RepID=A0A6G1JR08_9PLEO|nr:hypothetical protein K504DRAFT_214168 [Pleomassaria siparia CBS 279.74]